MSTRGIYLAIAKSVEKRSELNLFLNTTFSMNTKMTRRMTLLKLTENYNINCLEMFILPNVTFKEEMRYESDYVYPNKESTLLL